MDPKPNFHLKVPLGQITINWLKSALFGSLAWPVILVFTEGFEWDWGIMQAYIWIAGLSLCFSIFYSIPALLLFLLCGYVLNRNKVTFGTYCIWQNGIHLLAAVATFNLLDMEQVADFELTLITGMAICYTFCGLLVWNKMYYDLYKNTTKPSQL